MHRSHVVLILAASLSSSCALEPIDRPEAPILLEGEDGMRVPVELDVACAALARAPEPPSGFTVGDFFACLTDESHAALDALYRAEAARVGEHVPASLDELVARHGSVPLAGVSLRELAFGPDAVGPHEEIVPGVAPERVPRYTFPSQYGINPTKCAASCLSTWVDVVGGRRRIAFGAAQKGASPVKDDDRKRFLDEIDPGTFPDFRQANLANAELKSTGCGPVSAVNLFEWWGIPFYKGSTELTTFDARVAYIAGRMKTLSGVNFTDDDDYLDFVTDYPVELQGAGRISGHPGYHYMRDDPEAWKVMMSYVARGFPVVVLYSTSDSALHWALITGLKGGKLLIANAGDRTVADFFDQWHAWQDLSWYATIGAELFVSKSTFFALTGWGPSIPLPSRFAARTSNAYLPSYTTTSSYLFRYCVGANDELGTDAEAVHVQPWANEPSGALPGYCMFLHPTSALTLEPRPTASTVTTASGAQVTLSLASTARLTSFVTNNPGVRCIWYGYAGSKWKKLADEQCSKSAARSFTFANDGTYSKVTVQVHSAELARATWTIKTSP